MKYGRQRKNLPLCFAIYGEIRYWVIMSRLRLFASISLVIFTACDTPMAAAKREKLGISWDEWQQGVRTKEAKDDFEARKRQDKERAIQMEFEGRRDYVAAHPNLPPEIASGIMNRKLVRGMNADQVYLVWGYPKKVNKSVGATANINNAYLIWVDTRISKTAYWIAGKPPNEDATNNADLKALDSTVKR